ncbi:MAG TPA: GNAT family N-acetyltransferase [Kofleriaceae bacterium]|nr:GNAT family N-acetyltransferase [Kofleriaceae bacterium]
MQTDLAISVRRATAADASALAALVNRAYSIEEFFVEGDRTNATEIAGLIEKGTFIVLEYAGGLAAAVWVETSRERGYFGMLSVLPEMQKHGLGKRLVRIAEAMCEAAGCDEMTLQIINLREELARWYRSLGYVEIGTKPYEHRAVKQPCHFVQMRKSLRSVTGLGAVKAAAA